MQSYIKLCKTNKIKNIFIILFVFKFFYIFINIEYKTYTLYVKSNKNKVISK
jgi:hypothetical protein